MPKQKEVTEDANTVRTTDLASEFGYTGPYLRKVLREGVEAGKVQHEPRTRWEWEEGTDELQNVRDFLSAHKEQAEAAAAARAEADDEDDDEDEDEDEDDYEDDE